MKNMQTNFFGVTVLLSAFSMPIQAAELTRVSVTGGIDPAATTNQGETFYKTTFQFLYQGGDIIFSSNPDGTGETFADDKVVFTITQPDGNKVKYSYFYAPACGSDWIPLKPKNLKSKFKPGLNTVTIEIQDVCGGGASASPMWLLNK